MNSQDARRHYNRGVCLQSQGQIEKAEHHYQRAIEDDPEYAKAHCNYGLLLKQQGRLEEAEYHYQRVIEHNPEDDKVHYNYGLLLKEQGRLEEAEHHYQQAIEHNPEDADIHCNYGLLLKEQGRLEEANRHLHRATELGYEGAGSHMPDSEIQAAISEGGGTQQDSLSPSSTRGRSCDSRNGIPQRLPVGETSAGGTLPVQMESIASPPRRPDLTREDMTVAEKIRSGEQAIMQKAWLPKSQQPPAVVMLQEIDTKARKTLTRETVESFQSQSDAWRIIDSCERDKPRWKSSEHITGVISTGESPPWIAVEHMDGGDLRARLKNHPNGLPVREALRLGEGVCQGLGVAHSLRRVHLDVKPANVLLKRPSESKDGNEDEEEYPWPKLTNWGLARTFAKKTGSMDTPSVNYAAPEQFDPAEFGDPDQITDIYQAGALMYALLTGEPPATGSQLAVMRQVLSEKSVTLPSDQRAELPEVVDAVIGVALEREKAARYNSIHSFKYALSALRTGERLPQRVWSQIETE